MATSGNQGVNLLRASIQAVERLEEGVPIEPLAVDHSVQVERNGGRRFLDRHGDAVGGTEANGVWGVRS